MSEPLGGIRQRWYLAGYEWMKPPSSVAPLEPMTMEQSARLADGSLHTETGLPYDGAPVKPDKHKWQVSWEDLAGADLAGAREMQASSEDLDCCPWQEICEVFEFAEGEPYAGALQRREGLSQCPVTPSVTADLVPRLKINGVTATLTLGSPDAKGRTPWAASGTAPYGGAKAAIWSNPFYKVRLTRGVFSLAEPHRTNFTATLEEV